MCDHSRCIDLLGWLEETEPTPWWSINDVVKSIFWFVTVKYIKEALGHIHKPAQPSTISGGSSTRRAAKYIKTI